VSRQPAAADWKRSKLELNLTLRAASLVYTRRFASGEPSWNRRTAASTPAVSSPGTPWLIT